jgi:quinol monooxygenase YgiN
VIDRRLFMAGVAGSMMSPLHAESPLALNVFELRQYTLKGGTRSAFTRLFEREFVQSQERVGSHVLAVFRDLEDPDRFVWMRGFADMDARKGALEAFYSGPVWKEFRNEANGMMVDSDNVLLLKSAGGAIDTKALADQGVFRVAIHRLRGVDAASFRTFFDARMQSLIAAAGVRVVASLTTETAANNFPRLPVRENDPVFIWVSRFRDEAAEGDFSRRLQAMSGWRDGIAETLLPALMQKAEVLRLVPS